jgi:hypothetical protein
MPLYARLSALPSDLRDGVELRYDGPIPLEAVAAAEAAAARRDPSRWMWRSPEARWVPIRGVA